MGEEQWKVIPGYEPYEVSTYGRVRRMHTDGYYYLSLRKNCYGYMEVSMSWPGGVNKLATVHRLVALAFIDNPEGKRCINHLDNDRANNHVENIEWCTHHENTQYMMKCNRGTPKKRVMAYNMETGERLYFDSIQDTKKYGFLPSSVCNCCHGERSNGRPAWTHRGYRWEYVE